MPVIKYVVPKVTNREQVLEAHIRALMDHVGAAYELIISIDRRVFGIPQDMHVDIRHWTEKADAAVDNARDYLEAK